MILVQADQLEQALDLELAWRLREMSAVKNLIDTAGSVPMKNAALRASIPALYSHWEGFIKRSSELYIHHVFSQRLSVRDVSAPIAGYFLEGAFTGAGGYSRSFDAARAIEFYLSNQSKKLRSRGNVKVATGSNLRFEVLQRITRELSIPDFMSIVDEALINVRLCDKRNFIAHGQSVPVTYEEFESCRLEVSDLMRSYKNRLDTAASNLEYVV
jgi:hypothetical protein